MKEILDVYCESCFKNFDSENVWDAIEYKDLILCNDCFDLKFDGGDFSQINFSE